ncbi:MAG: plasmid recombination protein [Rikenellaceae bacterium]|nr:plasmid recombination protein [Rikenellaceae bacterium]
MGYAVLHLDKAKGNDSGISAHIERTIQPKNVDPELTSLNKELIEFPEGIENRTQAIQHRIETANVARKVTSDQVRAIRLILTGTHQDMIRINEQAKLDQWCTDNIQ